MESAGLRDVDTPPHKRCRSTFKNTKLPTYSDVENDFKFALVIDRERNRVTVVDFGDPEQHHDHFQFGSGCLCPQSSTTALSMHVMPQLMRLNEEDFRALTGRGTVLGTMCSGSFWKRLKGYLKNCTGVFYRTLTLSAPPSIQQTYGSVGHSGVDRIG